MTLLRAERETSSAEIEILEVEKKAIKAILPKIMCELQQIRESLAFKYEEVEINNNAINEIENLYGHIIFSSEIFQTH